MPMIKTPNRTTTLHKQDKDACPTPFFMLFPWGRVAVGMAGLCLVCLFIYRVSHVGGRDVAQASAAAKWIALAAGAISIYPMAKCWGYNQWRVLVGIFLGILIRFLIIGIGVCIITLFTDIYKIHFVLFLKLYYFFFLIGDIWLAAWMIRHSRAADREGTGYGNVWDIVERI